MCERMQLPFVNEATIRTKVTKIRSEFMEDPASSSSTALKALKELTFSNGWLEKFKFRHGLKSRCHHSDAASAILEVVERGRANLQTITSGYEKRNISNMDESAYFYCMVRAKPVSKKRFPGRKSSKKCPTVVLASNADGSTKIPLLFVGTARQPRSFKGKTGENLGLNYANAAKGSMTTGIFQHWIGSFNEIMQGENRHVLLLLDNASSH